MRLATGSRVHDQAPQTTSRRGGAGRPVQTTPRRPDRAHPQTGAEGARAPADAVRPRTPRCGGRGPRRRRRGRRSPRRPDAAGSSRCRGTTSRSNESTTRSRSPDSVSASRVKSTVASNTSRGGTSASVTGCTRSAAEPEPGGTPPGDPEQVAAPRRGAVVGGHGLDERPGEQRHEQGVLDVGRHVRDPDLDGGKALARAGRRSRASRHRGRRPTPSICSPTDR